MRFPAPEAIEHSHLDEERYGHGRVRSAARHCPDIRESKRPARHCPDIRESPRSQLPESHLTTLTLLDEALHRLARGAGWLRLRIGQALHRLGPGYHELGFSTLGADARERCCRSGRWAAQSRALARRLQSFRSKVSLARRERTLLN